MVEAHQRADTFAEFFEKVQWRVRPDTLEVLQGHKHAELDMNVGPITEQEIKEVTHQLKKKTAAGWGYIPAE